MNLVERVGYEEWANGEWLATLPKFRNGDRAREVMGHIFSCYSRWLSEVSEWEHRDEMEPQMMDDPSALYEELRKAASGDLERRVEIFSRRAGKTVEFSAGQIMTHCMNHGTYHRGHLRGLAEAEGLTDFPDTDALFFWMKDLR